jgi:hypothetical protein
VQRQSGDPGLRHNELLQLIVTALARDRKRSKSDLASEGAPGVLHEDVVRWVESWDTGHELPRPKPRKP